ncbi:hypothetical protein FHS31_003064 [Sphingomonas vulcanisoli]|uniref:Transposase n=1 Tax=Sphingomonas vulcanisoli TaxID=1658060 RepID=A0ABX0TY72_9SPHN|nr:hypothetical protein [Sphingomonas vulcanisoli]
MSDLYLLTDERMARLKPYFPKRHGKHRVADRRVLSGIVFRQSQWAALARCVKECAAQDALQPVEAGGGEMGVFEQMLEELSAVDAERKMVMIEQRA